MSNNLTIKTFTQLYDHLAEAREWFDSMGIPTEGNRFASILSNVDLVRLHWNQPSLDDVLRDHQMHDVWISLLDAGSFVHIHQQFSRLNSSQLPRRRLREVVGGPLMPHDEGQDGASIQARNAVFELELASRLQAGGLRLTSFDDVEFEYDGTVVNVQCKRLHSQARVQENLDKACSQIASRIGNSRKRGIVALGIDKVIGADKNMVEVYDETALVREASNTVRAFLRSHDGKFHRIIDTRILLIMVDLRFIGRIRNDRDDLLVSGHETGLYPLCSTDTQQLVDTAFVEKLGKQLSASV